MSDQARVEDAPNLRPLPSAPRPPPHALRHNGPLQRVRKAALLQIFASRLYPKLLRAPRQVNLVRQGADPWLGDADRANAIFQGRYRFANSEVQLFNKPPWGVDAPSVEWAAEAAAFGWLRDFRADGGQAAKKGARELVRSWVERCGEWQPLAWRPDVLGRRVLAWCSHADFILRGADPHFRAFISDLSARERELFRFPPAEHPYYSRQPLEALEEQYPGWNSGGQYG